MKSGILLLTLLLGLTTLTAQKVKLKKDILLIDKVEVAKLTKEKNKAMMGMVSDYTLANLDGDVLLTATYTDLVPEDPNNNMVYFFEFTFPTLGDKKAYFGLSKLGTSKSLAKLVGKNGLIADGAIDAKALDKLIDKKGKTPEIKQDFTKVNRNRNFPVELREKGEISQVSEVIATYIDRGTQRGQDVYEFYLPNGTLAATIRFADGNNAKTIAVETYEDDRKHNARMDFDGKTIASAAIDRNYFTLKRIAKWLVENKYL